jgi:hypothetical protein
MYGGLKSSTINDYYKAAPEMHQTPMQRVFREENFGIRPGTKTRIHKLTPDEEEVEEHTLKEWDAIEEAELKALEGHS